MLNRPGLVTHMDVILSSGGKYHAYHLARAFEKTGSLRQFITTIYDRYETGIDRSRVTQIPLPEILAQGIWRIPTPNSVYYGYYVRDNLFDLWSRRFITGGDVFNVFNHFGLYAIERAKDHGMKVIVERGSTHPVTQDRLMREEYARFGLRFSSRASMLFEKHIKEYEEADAIAVVSDFVHRSMVNEGVPEDKLIRVHLGFDPQRFDYKPEVKTDDTFRILYAGQLSLRKGLQYLLAAYEKLNLPNAELVFVGDPFHDSQTFLPQYEGLYTHKRFVPQAELVELYNNASVFVLPSIEDGFGMVVYEAAACGLPVIVTENVGAAIRDGQDGFVVPIRDPDALADKLLLLYENDELRRQMGQSARDYVQQFTWEHYHTEVVEKYSQV